MNATCIAAIKIESASAKIRNGPPNDDDEDLKLPFWTGVIPFSQQARMPVEFPAANRTVPVPGYINDWRFVFNQNSNDELKSFKSNANSHSATEMDREAESYSPRITEMVGIRTIARKQFKVYTIAARDKQVEPTIVDAATQQFEHAIDWPAHDSGYGFLTVHFGESIWFLIDIWKDDILCHFVFRSEYHNPPEIEPGPKDGTSACVWELEVTKHERDAWVRHIMSNPNEPDFDSYLEDNLFIAI